MKAIGSLIELNPMHKGHIYFASEVKKQCDALVGVMSGPLVQRGEFAILDKWTRARIALEHGFDLILELPQYFVLQSARKFAQGGLMILSLIDDIKGLAFGLEENTSPKELEDLLQKIEDENIQEKIYQEIQKGISYRNSYEKILQTKLYPNKILALEYLSAKRVYAPSYQALVVARKNNYHMTNLDSNPSATALREAIKEGKEEEALDFMAKSPSLNMDELLSKEKIQSPLLFHYFQIAILMDKITFSSSGHYEIGMENRLKEAFIKAHSFEEAIQIASNKRHSKARYRRLLMTSLLNFPKEEISLDALYLRPLAFNEKGKELLKKAKAPIVQKISDRKLSEKQERLFCIDKKAQELYEYLIGSQEKMDFQQKFFYPQKKD